MGTHWDISFWNDILVYTWNTVTYIKHVWLKYNYKNVLVFRLRDKNGVANGRFFRNYGSKQYVLLWWDSEHMLVSHYWYISERTCYRWLYMYVASDTTTGTYQLEFALDDIIRPQTQLPVHTCIK